MARMSNVVKRIKDSSLLLEMRTEAASELDTLVCEGGANAALQACSAGAVISLVELLAVVFLARGSVDCDPAVDAVVSIMKEAGAKPAQEACTGGAIPLLMKLAADTEANASARANAAWAVGYILKVSGAEGIAQSRIAGCVQVLVQLVGTVVLEPGFRGKAVWALRVLVEVGGAEIQAEARAAGASAVLASTRDEPGLPHWIATYVREAIRILAEPRPPMLPTLPLKALASTPRGFGSETPRSAVVKASSARSYKSAGGSAVITPRLPTTRTLSEGRQALPNSSRKSSSRRSTPR